MGKFTALAVGKGDAFLWEASDQVRFLVDGGASAQSTQVSLQTRGIKRLEVVVCTHGDHDHWNGLLSLLRDPAIEVGEVWIPARWGDGLSQLATNPALVLEQLREECRSTIPEDGSAAAMEGDYHDLREVEAAVVDGPDIRRHIRDPLRWYYHWTPGSEWLRFERTVKIAGGIWRVVRAALLKGCMLRWFEYGAAPGQAHPWLMPINSGEMLRVRRVDGVMRWIQLSLKNSEALVLVGKHPDSPPVLFSSDSDFQFDLEHLPRRPMLITAPHHGSEQNARVYNKIRAHAGADHVWVRSDWSSKNRPCDEFKVINHDTRGCTSCAICERSSFGCQPVEAADVDGKWEITAGRCAGT